MECHEKSLRLVCSIIGYAGLSVAKYPLDLWHIKIYTGNLDTVAGHECPSHYGLSEKTNPPPKWYQTMSSTGVYFQFSNPDDLINMIVVAVVVSGSGDWC